MFEGIDKIDKTVLLWINEHHSVFLDNLMIFVSGKLSWLPLYLVILYFIFRDFKWKTPLILIFIAIAITLSDQTSVHLFKNIFQRLRPCHQPELVSMLWLPKSCGGLYGFVSSHAANSFSFVTFTTLLFKKRWLTYLLIFWALLIGYSRIYLAAHFPTDVFFGSLLGIITGYIAFYLYQITDLLIKSRKNTEA